MGSSFKLQLPTFKQGTAEDFLHFLHKFNEAKGKLGYNTCPKLESGLERLLQGNARNEWNTIKQMIAPTTQSVAAFNEHIAALKKIYVPDPSTIDIQQNYLQRIKKNNKLLVPQFLDWMKYINMFISQFPAANEESTFTTEEIKKTVLPLYAS